MLSLRDNPKLTEFVPRSCLEPAKAVASLTMAYPPPTPDLPIPISLVGSRYLLFSAPIVAYLRREHNITGVLIGSLPHVPQQSVFLGLPLELMPEEARLLCEKGIAFIADDTATHQSAFLQGGLSAQEKREFARLVDMQAQEAARREGSKKQARKEKAMGMRGLLDTPKARAESVESESSWEAGASFFPSYASAGERFSPDTSRTASPAPSETSTATLRSTAVPREERFITPTTSYPPLTVPSSDKAAALPPVPTSYPLFKHLHQNGYYMTPGLRFGCHYSTYPGDQLRFHSHFLAYGREWDEDFDLLDLVGGGRLGTGTKKGYLVGGIQPSNDAVGIAEKGAEDEGLVRAFCIEWAGQ